MNEALLKAAITANVSAALVEDIGSGDLTAQLIPEAQQARATVITRQPMVLAGRLWFDACFQAIDPAVQIEWAAEEGAVCAAGSVLVTLTGSARTLLTGERPALNFLQTLSATATQTRHLMGLLVGTKTRLLDTRKTLPGLRIAQKYAVLVGGGTNHRLGLYDAFLIKENHIAAAGSISAAVAQARALAPQKPVEVEVETHAELVEAVAAGADRIMLDNFSLDAMTEAVGYVAGRMELEASGGVTAATIRAIAETGVDFISVGTLTKDIQAIDLSMRLI